MRDATTPAWKRALDELTFKDLLAYPRDERGMAALVRTTVGSQLLHCPDAGRWYVYDGQRWKRDDRQSRLVQQYVHLVGDAVARAGRQRKECSDPEREKAEQRAVAQLNQQFGAYARVRAIIGMMAGDVRYRVELDALDADPYLLNFRNGTYDVRTGELRPHDITDRVTRVVDRELDLALAYESGAAQRWRDGLLRQADGEVELALALERALAYGLLGTNPEQKIFFLVGASGIGKSKTLEVVADLFEDYAERGDVRLLLVERFGRHDAVTAKLVGSRYVIISETDEHQQVDLPQLKDLTGANKVTTRLLREQQHDTRVTWTIFVSTNDLPSVSDPDPAMMRRMVLVQLSERQREAREFQLDYAERVLEDEGDAVCARLMVRLHEWYEAYQATARDPKRATSGLVQHPAFVAASDQYQRANDTVAEFVDEMIKVDPEVSDRSTPVLRAYTRYCEDAGVVPLGRTKFWRRMKVLTACTNGSGGLVRGVTLAVQGVRWGE